MGPNNAWYNGGTMPSVGTAGLQNPYGVNQSWQNNIQMPNTNQQNAYQVASQTNLSQFAWINNPGVVDMWPMAAGSEMTFIDPEHLRLYVRRVDEWNHPVKTRVFALNEITDAPEKPAAPAINMEELKNFLSTEVDRAVNNKMSNVFGGFSSSVTPAVVDTKRGE